MTEQDEIAERHWAEQLADHEARLEFWEERRRRFVVMAGVPFTVGLILAYVLALLPSSHRFFEVFSPTALTVATALSFLLSATFVLMEYLQTGFKKPRAPDRHEFLADWSRPDSMPVIEDEFEGEQLAKNCGENSIGRLEIEVSDLTRRGNTNLALGMATTILGLAILGVTVFYQTREPADWWELTSHFVPRMTLALFVEVFAYFFLNLYKDGLAQIKYYQNEMTNIEARLAALVVAERSKTPSLLKEVVHALATTERNRVLRKGETTVEVEIARGSQAAGLELTKAFAGITGGHAEKKK